MAKITKITPQQRDPERVNVFVDYDYCCSIRKRTFQAMNLQVGSEISCEELRKRETFFWKQAYGENAWKREKVRIDKIKPLIEGIDKRVEVKLVGFGADTTELIEKHPDEMGKPDIDIVLKDQPDIQVCKVEVTGTERARAGEGYWVRLDKISYAERHPEEDVWIALHFALPQEQVVFIKALAGKKYTAETKEINSAGEKMCVFYDGDPEVKSTEEFSAHLQLKLLNLT